MRFIDAHGFAGGFSLGVVQAGFELVGKRETNPPFGTANMEANRHLLGNDWKSQADSDYNAWEANDVELVIGCPPCSGFSLLSTASFRGVDSPVNSCMRGLVSFGARCRPELLIFESVQQAFSQGRSLMQELRWDLERRTGQLYDLVHVKHNALSVGGAALRKRYFFVATRVPFGIEPPVVTRVPALDDVISDLEGLGVSWGPQPYRRGPSWWAESRRSSAGAVDGMAGLRPNSHTERLRELIAWEPWAPGERISVVARRCLERYGDLPPRWAGSKEKLVREDFKMGFLQTTRWRGDRVARVITGAGMSNGLHPREDRLFTHRETARIMGFPDDWRIEPLAGVRGLEATWGKGIPVDCGRWIATWARRALEGSPGGVTGEEIGERERLIDVTHAYRAVSRER